MQQLSLSVVDVGLSVLVGYNAGAFVGAVLGFDVGGPVVTGDVVGSDVMDDVGALVWGGAH